MRISLSSKSQFLGQESESGSQGGEKYHLPTRPAGQAGPLACLTSSLPPRFALHFSAHCASRVVILFLGWLFFFYILFGLIQNSLLCQAGGQPAH